MWLAKMSALDTRSLADAQCWVIVTRKSYKQTWCIISCHTLLYSFQDTCIEAVEGWGYAMRMSGVESSLTYGCVLLQCVDSRSSSSTE